MNSLPGFGPCQVDVWLGEVSGKTICLQESVTNLTDHTSVVSKREKFNAAGIPTVWTVSTLKENSAFETKKVALKQVEMNATFNEEDIFAPKFPPDYIVSDLSSGRGVILQNPHPEIPARK